MNIAKQTILFCLIGFINLFLFAIFLRLIFILTQNTIIASSFASSACIFFSYFALRKFVFSNLFQLKKFLIFSFLGFITTQIYVLFLTPFMTINFLTFTCAAVVAVQNFALNKLYND